MGAVVELSSLFNGKSPRAQRARWGKSLHPWMLVLQALVATFVIIGILLLVAGQSIGWALIGLAAIPAMIVEWYHRELESVPRDTNGTRVDDLLDSDILGVLPDQPTPQQIAQVIARSKGGIFFAGRFGVGGGFLEQLVSSDRKDTPAIFQEAIAIARPNGSRISAGVLVLAMVRQLPGKMTLLGHLQLEEDDLIRGIQWYHHLDDLIQYHRSQPKSPGGIGRDWSFGWIPYLSRFGVNISGAQIAPQQAREETIKILLRSLEGGRGTVNLVGQTGVGKTELVYQLASLLMNPRSDVPAKLRYKQVFMLDASKILSGASGRGQVEGLVQAILGEAYAAKNIVVYLDNAQLFFEEGVGSVDISTLLMPILEAGRLQVILSMDEQRFLRISKRLPTLSSNVQRVSVHPTDEAGTLKILEEKLPSIEYRHKVTYMYQALKEAYKLGARYIYDVSMPGQAVSLLEAAAEHAEDRLVTASSVQKAIEASTGVKVGSVDTDDERQKLLNLEALIHQRMIGQDRAVNVVSDALRRARAGVRSQGRPVGTFLFLGPTGVGKTELAKSLAAVYFGGEENMIRLDMNEFVTQDDVARLISDGTEDPSSLTAQVMKRPFSVVLLDEIEKAHSSVLSTLLQLLDEGVLRDSRNREVSFRDTIVIATSNAGANRIQEYIQRGYKLEQFEKPFIDELINSHIFHPEFLNRFDEMVVFRPLEKNELLQVVDLILVSINKNLSEQKINVVVAQDAKEYLVEAGYDPRLGARPMRRVVQRAVESTVAKLLLSQSVQPGGTIELTRDQLHGILDTKQKADQIADASAL